MKTQLITLLKNAKVKDTEIVKDHRETYDIPDDDETIIFKVEQTDGDTKTEEYFLCLELDDSTAHNDNNIVLFFDNQFFEVLEIINTNPVIS